jgi:hypothetical protein
LADIRINIRSYPIIVVSVIKGRRNFYPLGLLNNNREGGSSLLKARKEAISFIEITLSVNDGPGILLKLNRFCVRNSPALILTPITLVSYLIN